MAVLLFRGTAMQRRPQTMNYSMTNGFFSGMEWRRRVALVAALACGMMTIQQGAHCFVIFAPSSGASSARSHRPSRHPRSTASSSALFGIAEWRDTFFDFPGTGDDRRLGTESGGPPKAVNLLPFPYQQVLLQGETKQLRLYEERFVKLFENSMEQHSGVVAMGLLADSGIIQTVPLCELEAFNRIEGFGIFVTIRVVGRAQVLEITQQEPFIQAVVMELADRLPPNLELYVAGWRRMIKLASY